ncbi:alpha/beta hydrolase [Humibacter ginsengiterrae]
MTARPVTRRVALGTGIGIAAAAVLTGAGIAVNENLLPGRSTMYRALGLDGPDGVVPSIAAGPVVAGSFVSAHMGGRRVGYEIAYPPGTKPGAELPVAVVLHGYGDDQRAAFSTSMRFDAYLAQAVRSRKPFALASVAGGNGYWHPREDGTDAGAMVVDELLPQLAARGLRTRPADRVAFMGWSMGGYGALRLGGVLGNSRVAAVAVESPALWHTFGQAAKGAFDDAADFARNTVFGRQSDLAGVAVRIDCGTGDGFYPNVRDYVAGFSAHPAGGLEAGGHDPGFWRRLAPAQLAFVGDALASV